MTTTIEFINRTPIDRLKKWCAIMDKEWIDVIDVRGAISNAKFYLKCGDGTEEEIFSGDTIIYDFETKTFHYDYTKRMIKAASRLFNNEVERNLLHASAPNQKQNENLKTYIVKPSPPTSPDEKHDNLRCRI